MLTTGCGKAHLMRRALRATMTLQHAWLTWTWGRGSSEQPQPVPVQHALFRQRRGGACAARVLILHRLLHSQGLLSHLPLML